jgi:DNA primase
MARDYLTKRGVSADAIKLFRLGAAPELWDDTVNWAKSKNYELPLVEKAGLIIQKAESGKRKAESGNVEADSTIQQFNDLTPRNYYDRFRGRLMFPICDEQGRVIGFSGRILSGDEKTAKYVNSPETPIFTKSKVFFGLDKSKRALLDAQSAIVCEGQLDLIACFMAGVQNVVAPQGTAFTDQHARIIKRYVDEAILCFDSDEAGQNAAVRSLDHLLASGIAVRVAVMPKPHDPDSFIKNFGGEKFRELVQSADGFFDYYLNRLCATNEITTDKGRIAVLRGMAEAVHKTGNDVLVDKYAQKTALRLGVSPEAVRAEFRKIPAVKNASADNADETFESTAPSEASRPPETEFWLLKLLLLHDELVSWAALHLDANWISHPPARQIISQRLAAQTKENWKNLGAFLDECDSPEMKSLITEAVAQDRKIPNPGQQLADVTLKLRNQFLDREIAALTQKAVPPDISDAEKLRRQKRAKLFEPGGA